MADPSDVARFRLAPVNKELELAAARAGLGDIPAAELAPRGQVTLNNLTARLRDGCDILYLVAHGMLVEGEPWLFLEKEDGTADRVAGRELADPHRTSWRTVPDWPYSSPARVPAPGRPSPVPGTTRRLAGLGPRLAEAGVPCGDRHAGQRHHEDRRGRSCPSSSVSCAGTAWPIARWPWPAGAGRDRPDWWMPVLFTCLKSARVWEPGVAATEKKKKKKEARSEGAQIDVNQQVGGDVSGEVTGVKVGTVHGNVNLQGPVTVTVPGLAAEVAATLMSQEARHLPKTCACPSSRPNRSSRGA